jgi:hypothetical protein
MTIERRCMPMKWIPAVLALLAIFCVANRLPAQVLGPCGVPEESGEAGEAAGQTAVSAPAIESNQVPLPGERALDFELTAVVGDEIKKIKLSDYQGMYRVLCFYPADFTFV